MLYYSMIIFIPSYPANPPVEPVCDVDGLTMVGTDAPGGGSPVPCNVRDARARGRGT
jgi:hypothetical protein